MKEDLKQVTHLDVPFKEFMPGQIIQSEQFNDDMRDIEDKVNEVVDAHNSTTNTLIEHIDNKENPHEVTAHQVGTYTVEEIDNYVEDLKSGNFNDGAITNRVMGENSVNTSNLVNNSVTLAKLDKNVGAQLDLTGNTTITHSYSKEEIDKKFEEYQAGTIIDGTIDVDKLKTDVGDKINISNNPSIVNRYTKVEVDRLIEQNGLPRDWGALVDTDDDTYDYIPVADFMVADSFVVEESDVLDFKIKEVVDARGSYDTIKERIEHIESQLATFISFINKIN